MNESGQSYEGAFGQMLRFCVLRSKTFVPLLGLIEVAELVSCLKRTVAHVLVIVVSVGYGVVKPRLGSTLNQVATRRRSFIRMRLPLLLGSHCRLFVLFVVCNRRLDARLDGL